MWREYLTLWVYWHNKKRHLILKVKPQEVLVLVIVVVITDLVDLVTAPPHTHTTSWPRFSSHQEVRKNIHTWFYCSPAPSITHHYSECVCSCVCVWGFSPSHCLVKFALVVAAQVRKCVISGNLPLRVKFAPHEWCSDGEAAVATRRCCAGVFLACEGIRPLQWSGALSWRCAPDCSFPDIIHVCLSEGNVN